VTLDVTGKYFIYECVLVDYPIIIARKLGLLCTDLRGQMLLNKVRQICNEWFI